MSGITLLDGGMGQELIARSGNSPTPLWATRVMIDRPELVRDVHADYFAAGASVATVNSYALHRDRLSPEGMEDSLPVLFDAALSAAESARQERGSGRIAGSVGPLVASYRPDAHPPHETAVPLYAEVAGVLAPRCDFLIVETVASLAHARAALEGVIGAGKPVWLSVTVDDEDGALLRSGEPTEEAGKIAAEMGAEAVLANCSAPEAMEAAMNALSKAGLPFGAYANGFQKITKEFLYPRPTVASLAARRDLSPEAYARFAMGWIGQGATIVGGCCETGPAHIAAIAAALSEAGHRIV